LAIDEKSSSPRTTSAGGGPVTEALAAGSAGHAGAAAIKLTFQSDRSPGADYLLSRRSFLNSTLGAGLASATSDQAAAQTAAVQPARKRLIVDSQVHVCKAESADSPWIRGLTPQMPEPFTIAKLVPLMDEAGVDRATSWAASR